MVTAARGARVDVEAVVLAGVCRRRRPCGRAGTRRRPRAAAGPPPRRRSSRPRLRRSGRAARRPRRPSRRRPGACSGGIGPAGPVGGAAPAAGGARDAGAGHTGAAAASAAPVAAPKTWVRPSAIGSPTAGAGAVAGAGRQRAACGHAADRLGEGAAVGEAVGGVLGQRALDQQPDGRRDVRGQRRRGPVDVRERDGHLRGAVEGPGAGQALVGDDAEGVDVGGGGDLHALRLLRGEVLGGADDHAGAGERGGVAGLGDAEVGQLHHAVGPDHEVAGLDVAVHHPGPVRGGQPVGGLAEHVQRPVDRELALLVQDRDQRLALDELHDEEGQLLVAGVVDGLAVVVDRGDVRMGQGGRVPGLVAEPGQEVRIAGVLAARAPWPRRSGRGPGRAPSTPRPSRRWRWGR